MELTDGDKTYTYTLHTDINKITLEDVSYIIHLFIKNQIDKSILVETGKYELVNPGTLALLELSINKLLEKVTG
jgi:hypothetical protein